jgi:hypothetical protein
MDEQSIEPSRARSTPEDQIAEPPRLDGPSVSDEDQPIAVAADQPSFAQPTTPQPGVNQQDFNQQGFNQPSFAQPVAPTYAPPPNWQQTAQPQNPWQPGVSQPVADLPQSPWQPTVAMQAGQPMPVANLPQSPWQPNGQAPMAPVGQQLQQIWPEPEPWHPPLLAQAGLPPGWHAPLRTDLVPVVPRKRRSKRLLLIAAAVVVLLVAGATTWLVWPPDRSPFEQAVANLAVQPVVNYTSALPDGTQFDGRVTNQGDAIGWLTGLGVKFPFMIVNGKMFVRVDGLLPSGTSSDLDLDLLKNRWVTGDVGDLAPLLKQDVTASAIAGKLRDQVARTKDLPTPSDDGTTIDGLDVLKADTPDGTLYVAKKEPYRVVRWIDKNTKKAAAAFTDPGRKLKLNGERAAYTGLGTADFKTVTADSVDQTYDELETNVGQLGDAIDTSVSFSLDGIDNLDHYKDCEQTGCQVVAHVTATPAPGLSVPAQVTVQMTADVTIDDIPAGSCSTTDKLSSSGPGTLSCLDKDMHAGYRQAADKAEADAEAKAGNSPFIYYWVTAEVRVHPLVLASVDTVAEGKRLESFRPDHACGWTDKGGAGRVPVDLYNEFDGRLDTARFPDFEIHVYQNGQPYGDFGPSGWFAKNGAATPSDPPAQLNQLLKLAAVKFMQTNGALKDGDNTDGDKWKRPAGKC